MKRLIIIVSIFLLSGCKTTNLTSSHKNNKLPNNWNFKVEFNDKKELNLFDTKRLQSCFLNCETYNPTQILQETNGNKYLSLTAKKGTQVIGRNKNSYRNELGTKPSYNQFNLEGLELWYGFRVKKPKDIQNESLDNTFTQIKQVTKIHLGSSKLDCSKGVVFHMNSDGYLFNGDGINYIKFFEGKLISENWTAYKIGIKFSYKEDGWIKVFKNNSNVWFQKGPNLITKFYNKKLCNLKNINLFGNHLRIGVYAKSNDSNAIDTLHFDDFVSGNSEQRVDNFHKKTKK